LNGFGKELYFQGICHLNDFFSKMQIFGQIFFYRCLQKRFVKTIQVESKRTSSYEQFLYNGNATALHHSVVYNREVFSQQLLSTVCCKRAHLYIINSTELREMFVQLRDVVQHRWDFLHH